MCAYLYVRDSSICNVGRGNAIDERALADALLSPSGSGNFAPGICAALDVFTREPLPEDSPLWEVSPARLLISPHSADQTDQYWDAAAAVFEQNARAFLGEDPGAMGPRVDLNLGY